MKVLRPLFLSMLLFIVMCPLFGADLIVYPKSPSAAKTSVFTVEVNKTEIPVYDFMDYHYDPWSQLARESPDSMRTNFFSQWGDIL
ncbi:MAG: hypothetical protein P1U58_14365 [Verrucomicrobiales bacterium]|nr:hypothetical protein [Verrucomicrobiales bacterium]